MHALVLNQMQTLFLVLRIFQRYFFTLYVCTAQGFTDCSKPSPGKVYGQSGKIDACYSMTKRSESSSFK
jgi:hypothetical protein